MKEIRKKTWPKEFESILSGKKKLDVRINDFDLKEAKEKGIIVMSLFELED